MGKMTRTRRTLIAADMARMLRELQQASAQGVSTEQLQPTVERTLVIRGHSPLRRDQSSMAVLGSAAASASRAVSLRCVCDTPSQSN